MLASTAAPNIVTLANDLVNPMAHTINAGFSKELGPVLGIHVDAIYTKTYDYTVRVDINTHDPVTGVRPLPAWGRIRNFQSVGNAWYKAFLVRLDKRLSNRYLYMLSYTLGKSDVDFGGSVGGAVRTDAYNPDVDKGPSGMDRRHSFVASASVLLPYDVQLGAVYTLRSTMPFSSYAGTDLNRDGAVTDFVPGSAMNQGNRNLDISLMNSYRASLGLSPVSEDQFDSNRYSDLSVRVSKSFSFGDDRRLELIAQVFNVLGTDNLCVAGACSWVTNVRSSSFGRILTAQPRQQGELAVKIVF